MASHFCSGHSLKKHTSGIQVADLRAACLCRLNKHFAHVVLTDSQGSSATKQAGAFLRYIIKSLSFITMSAPPG